MSNMSVDLEVEFNFDAAGAREQSNTAPGGDPGGYRMNEFKSC